MQDRFKFKCWHKSTKTMYEVWSFSKNFIEATPDFVVTSIRKFKTKDCTLLQCTGLKDKNGKLIYEGDIVRSDKYPYMSQEQDNYYAEICWDKKSAQFFYYTFKNPKFNDVSGISTGNTGNLDEYNWEVIGNIYENPELLEDK